LIDGARERMLEDWIWEVVRFEGFWDRLRAVLAAVVEDGRGVELEEEGPAVAEVERMLVRRDPKVEGEVARRFRSVQTRRAYMVSVQEHNITERI
jgi:hypothetical protein